MGGDHIVISLVSRPLIGQKLGTLSNVVQCSYTTSNSTNFMLWRPSAQQKWMILKKKDEDDHKIKTTS